MDFRTAQLLMCAPEIGVRESRMIQGEYLLTAEDLLNCVKFPDSVARGVYQIDIHSPDGSGTYLRQIPKGDYYTIPYRSLIPKGMENLLAAGRCLSSTHEAQSAYRVMPICCCIGEGAALRRHWPLRRAAAYRRCPIRPFISNWTGMGQNTRAGKISFLNKNRRVLPRKNSQRRSV